MEAEEPSADDEKWDVFISYSWRPGPDGMRRDVELATRLLAALEKRHLRVWRDQERIRAGEDISAALEQAIRSSTLVVALLSRQHAESRICQYEVIYALATASSSGPPPLYPVLVEGEGTPAAYPAGIFERNAYRWDGSDETLDQLCEAIVSQIAGRSVEKAQRAAPRRTGVTGVPGVTGARFVGRLPDVLRLYSLLVGRFGGPDAAAVHYAPIVLLHGEPGMGKSALGAFFAERFSGRFDHGVLWLDSAGDRVDARIGDDAQRDVVVRSLTAGVERWLSDRRQALQSDASLDPEARWREVRAAVVKHLQQNPGKLLVVIDDVPGGLNLADVTFGSDQIATLVTSRSNSLAHQGAEPILVGPFQPFESLLLLTNARDAGGALRRAGVDPWDGAEPVARRLADEVGHHPMAVDLLGIRLRDHGVDVSALLEEVRSAAPEFIDVEGVTLPLQHRGSILATVGASLRAAAHVSRAAEVLRMLSVTPAGRPVPVEALAQGISVSRSSAQKVVAELEAQGLVRLRSDAPGTGATQHQIVQAVSSELWRRGEAPFDKGRPPEPDLSHRFAQWFYVEGERLRNRDDLAAAETHAVALAVLERARQEGPPGCDQAVQCAYGWLAQARLTYRADKNATDPADLDAAFGQIQAAKQAVEPFLDHLSAQFAFHTADALRGLVLSLRSRLLPGNKVEAAREALKVIVGADDARSALADIALAIPSDTSPLDHDYVRDVLARSRYNMPGRAISIVQALMSERPDGWVGEARDVLEDAERSYSEVLELRRALWQDDPAEPSRILSQAASEHGIGLVRYFRALLPDDDARRMALFCAALPQLERGLRMRDAAANEQDVCKSLAMVLKVLLAMVTLQQGDHRAVLAAHATRWDAAVRRAQVFDGLGQLRQQPPTSPAVRHRNDLRDRLLDRLSAASLAGPGTSEVDDLLSLVVDWLALEYVTDTWSPLAPEAPDNLAWELEVLTERHVDE